MFFKYLSNSAATVVVERLCFYRCLSTGGGGVHPTPRQTPPPVGKHPALEMAAAADGTHPAGMHSCYERFYFCTGNQGEMVSFDLFTKKSENFRSVRVNYIRK